MGNWFTGDAKHELKIYSDGMSRSINERQGLVVEQAEDEEGWR